MIKIITFRVDRLKADGRLLFADWKAEGTAFPSVFSLSPFSLLRQGMGLVIHLGQMVKGQVGVTLGR